MASASASNPASSAPATAPKPLPLIHLNGFPGTGKLTIARALVELLNPCGRLVHNHLLINPADAVLHRTEPGYQDLRRALRAAVFTALAQNAAAHKTAYIFTDFQSGDAVGSATCAEYLAAAHARGCELVSVVVTCGEAANRARLLSAERAAQGKIVDSKLLAMFRHGVGPYRFEGPTTTSWTLDVTELSATQAARCILEHVLELCPEVRKCTENEFTIE